MSTGYELVGRVHQKQRTRDALMAAARALVADGVTPTVELTAERARTSLTTAYRYFPSQAALLAAAHPEITMTSLLPPNPPADVADRLELVVARVTDLVRDTEPQQRTMLRLSLDPERPGSKELLLRQGRVIGWLEEALAPLADDIGAAAVHALAVAIRSAIGIEAYVWLTDVAHVAPGDATNLMRWTARSLLDAARSGLASAAVRQDRGEQARRRVEGRVPPPLCSRGTTRPNRSARGRVGRTVRSEPEQPSGPSLSNATSARMRPFDRSTVLFWPSPCRGCCWVCGCLRDVRVGGQDAASPAVSAGAVTRSSVGLVPDEYAVAGSSRSPLTNPW